MKIVDNTKEIRVALETLKVGECFKYNLPDDEICMRVDTTPHILPGSMIFVLSLTKGKMWPELPTMMVCDMYTEVHAELRK